MMWGAMCLETSVRRPTWSQVPESVTERESYGLKLQEINNYWTNKAKTQLENAVIPGTLEYGYMEILNHDISIGVSKWKRQRMPEQEFGETEVQSRGRKSEGKEVSKGGIDWFLYREMVLIPLVFPYYKKIKALHPGKRIWFVDDNVSLHLKAHRSA